MPTGVWLIIAGILVALFLHQLLGLILAIIGVVLLVAPAVRSRQ